MPILVCRECGRLTNTAVSDHIDSKDGKADSCYAAFVDGEWVEGCNYKNTPYCTKITIDRKLLGR